MRVKTKLIYLAILTAGLVGCSFGPTSEQIRAKQEAEERRQQFLQEAETQERKEREERRAKIMNDAIAADAKDDKEQLDFYRDECRHDHKYDDEENKLCYRRHELMVKNGYRKHTTEAEAQLRREDFAENMRSLMSTITPSAGYSDDTPTYSTAPSGSGYGSPVMVVQPRPGTSVMDYGGGMSSYSDGRTSCNTAYGLTSCY